MPPLVRWMLSFGPTNPIAVRLVQNGSRRVRHLTIRAAYLGALVVVLLWALLVKVQDGTADYRALALAGASSFEIIAYLQIGLICIITPVFMAGAIAQEANPATWDILLASPLSSGQIVLGNLSGRLFFVLALLVSGLPLFALTQYFGGVPGRSIFASYAIAACAALLVGSIAIALSVSRLVGRRAVFAFYVSVVSYLAVTWAVDVQLRRALGGGVESTTWVTGLNPFLAMYALLDPSNYVRWPEGSAWMLRQPVTVWCVGSGLLSLAMVVAAVITVRLGGLTALARGSAAVPWYRRMFGLGAKGAEHRPPRAVWQNPIAWREAAARNSTLGKMLARWAFVASGGAFGVGLIWWFHTDATATIPAFRSILLATIWGELAVITLVAINMSATAVSREREDGTLDLLLTTPITPGAYLFGKLRGLIAYLVPLLLVPLGTLALASIYVVFDGFGRAGGLWQRMGPGIDVPMVTPEAGLVAPVIVFPFMAFCCMVGLYWSLKSKGTLGSVIGAVGVAGVVGGIVGLCGWRSGADMETLGPVLAGLSPATAVYALIDPYAALGATVIGNSETVQARVALGIGAAIGAGVFIGVVYGLQASMVRGFDMTVRRLAGTR
ncbi:MAG: ABC transporter permease subunit [Phycisphaeraceae bacterium]|nr:ABC transporter permease subunit [Phycisphaeraceae bacterium]